MVILKIEDREKVDKVYETFMKVFMKKKNHSSFEYEKKQHHIYENPELSKHYYNESGEVTFQNKDGNTIKITVCRIHPHKHNGWSGLNGIPYLHLVINKLYNNNEQKLWELEVESGTLHYNAKLTSMEIPYDILKENEMDLKEFIENDNLESKEKTKKETSSKNTTQKKKDEIKAEKKETIFLLEQLDALTNSLNALENSKKETEAEMNRKIEDAKKEITSSYSTGIQETTNRIVETKNQIHEFYSLIAKYSNFDADLIGYAFEVIVSTIENTEYVYKNILHNYTKRVHGNIDSWDEEEEKYMDVLIKSEYAVNYYESSYKEKDKLDVMFDNGEILKINEYISLSFKKSNISFYNLDGEKLISNIKFGKFSYLKSFIDSLIEYRILNGLEEFTKDDMNAFIQKYFNDTRDALLRNLTKKANQKAIKLMIPVQ